jgi:hypothetical protein
MKFVLIIYFRHTLSSLFITKNLKRSRFYGLIVGTKFGRIAP